MNRSDVMSLADRDGLIWMDGEMVPWRDAKVHVLTHTFHYGLGVFEGVRAYKTPDKGTCIFRLQEHTDRLFRSAHILGMKMPFRQGDPEPGAKRCGAAERDWKKVTCAPCVSWVRREWACAPTTWVPTSMVAAWEWPSYMDPEARDRGIKVRTSSYTRHHVNISMCKAKANGNYINSMLACREAIEGGAEEALLLDNEGYVAEGSGENVFIVRDDKIYTPELTSCLEGITRDAIFVLAEELGTRYRNGASPGMRCTSPMRPSSPEPPPRWCRSANWTGAPSAVAVAGP